VDESSRNANMTLIAQGNNWWIESFDFARANLATGSATTTALTLERPGTYLGCGATMDIPPTETIAEIADISVSCRNIDDSELTIGDTITGIELLRTNNNANGVTFGVHVLIFMRGTGAGAG